MSDPHTEIGLSVRDVVVKFLTRSRRYYRRKDGTPTGEHLNLASSLRWLEETEQPGPSEDAPPLLVAALPISRLSRTHVRLMRLRMIAADLSRSYINKCVGHVRRFVRWAAHDDVGLCPRSVLLDVAALECLPAGRSEARETTPRTAVRPEHVAKTLPRLPRTARVLVQLMALTGSRLGQLVRLTTAEINTDDPSTWWGMPTYHKTAHRGKRLTIAFDARCQKLLGPLLLPFAPDNPIFASPRDGTRAYRRDSIARAIHRACVAADVPPWSPHQLRHMVAGQVRRALGLDSAQALLGHADQKTTERYAPVGDADAARAQAVVPGIGEIETDQLRFWG